MLLFLKQYISSSCPVRPVALLALFPRPNRPTVHAVHALCLIRLSSPRTPSDWFVSRASRCIEVLLITHVPGRQGRYVTLFQRSYSGQVLQTLPQLSRHIRLDPSGSGQVDSGYHCSGHTNTHHSPRLRGHTLRQATRAFQSRSR